MYTYTTQDHETFGNILGISDETSSALLEAGATIHCYEEPGGYEYVEVPDGTVVCIEEDTYTIHLGNQTFHYQNEGQYPGWITLVDSTTVV